MNNPTSSLISNLGNICRDISNFERRYARPAESVQLLAVSKRKPVAAIEEAIRGGQSHFGENYVDEAVEKIRLLDNSSLTWHFIGAIQSRKCLAIAQHFQWVHGVDRLKTANRLSSNRPKDVPPLNICIQVNLDNEPGKAGVALEEVASLARNCSTLPGLKLRGLMAIPALRTNFEEQRAAFATLREHFTTLQTEFQTMDTLSMGMSGDMEAAIAEGATIVRIGTAIFGARES